MTELSADYALASTERFESAINVAEAITAAYRASLDSPNDQREAAVLAEQFRAQFLEPKKGDLFAGRVRYPLVGVTSQPMGLGYYCAFDALREGASRYPDFAARASAIIRFWQVRTTEATIRAAYPPSVTRYLPSDAWTEESGIAFPLYRMGGTTLDYGKLVRLGLDGLETVARETPFSHVVPLLRQTIDRYAATVDDPAVRDTLLAIRHRPPVEFREAIQLIWLYALHAGSWNYGRLDTVLGPILSREMDDGGLTEEQAVGLLASWWHLMAANPSQYDHRVIIGGRGRPDEVAADRFGLCAIATTRRLRINHPQLTLRFYEGQHPALWDAALDAIGEGCTFPMLYNDDVNIPAVASSFGVDPVMAAEYTPFGCGEYVLGHYGLNSPNGVINLLKGLEVALHAGVDPLTGEKVAQAPTLGELTSMELVWKAYTEVIEPRIAAAAEQEAIEYRVTAEELPLGFISLLLSDCVERKTSAPGGGVRYLGGTLETYGNSNVADSLHVIDELVFRRREVSLPDLVAALDENFEGHDQLLQRCRAVVKYGNDEGGADAMACRVHEHVCEFSRRQAGAVGLFNYLVVIINNWANTVLGWRTGASAEGRLAGQPMANGNNPAPGADVRGPSAFLNSLAKLDPSIHAGSVQNMKFSREWFGPMRPKFEALLRAYFAGGGTQAMITVVSRDDLEAAMREPQKWGHLMVRVGGFSIRFVDLPHDAQLEVLGRTLN